MTRSDPVSIAQRLIRCESITPDAGGALDAIEELLAGAGFACERLVFETPGTAPVDNLFARLGNGEPHLCFAGHADVVPPGDAAVWRSPPFAGEIVDGVIIGRGAEDMKGGLAAALAAALDLVAADKPFPGSLSFLITGDEEGVAVNGTVRVLEWMAANGHVPDCCIVGEPASGEAPGDTIKVGRRGSLTGHLTVAGVQGHVAYPHLAANPVPALLRLIEAISAPLDTGSDHFEASNLEVTTVDVANPATNVIPAMAEARFNVRFNDHWTAASLEQWLRQRMDGAGITDPLRWTLEVQSNAEAFVTRPGPFLDLVSAAVARQTGREPARSTGGGTSDARFVSRYCPVVELGLVGRSMHQVDEHVPIGELEQLARIYQTVFEDYFRS